MTNHVAHKFTITGNEKDIQTFIDECFDTENQFNFNTLIPMPEILKNTIRGNTSAMQTEEYKAKEKEAIETTGHNNWHSWRLEHWETKWGAYSTDYENHGDLIELEFDTAWSCPKPIFEALSKKFPTLIFKGYALDEGFCFGAVISIEKGEFSIDYLEVHADLFEAFDYRFA